MFARRGEITPPTQKVTRSVTAAPDGDRVPNQDGLGINENLLDQQPQDSLPVLNRRFRCCLLESSQEAFEVFG